MHLSCEFEELFRAVPEFTWPLRCRGRWLAAASHSTVKASVCTNSGTAVIGDWNSRQMNSHVRQTNAWDGSFRQPPTYPRPKRTVAHERNTRNPLASLAVPGAGEARNEEACFGILVLTNFSNQVAKIR